MVAVRIIPCLDVRAGRVVKGVRFRDHVDMGDIIERARAYRDAEADELVFYDITASPENRSVDVEWVERVAAEIDIPFAVAGGIGDVERARAVLHAGADKISVNSPALRRPGLVRELADTFGSQCVVIGIDSIRDGGRFRLRANTGDPDNMIDPDLDTRAWIERVQMLGAGEIVLNCMDADGVRTGYDVEQLAEMRAVCDVPLIASGGAGRREHFLEVFERADVDGALAATVFHSDRIAIPELKEWLSEQGVATREVDDFEALAGQGVRADIDGTTHYAGKPELFADLGFDLDHAHVGGAGAHRTDGGTSEVVRESAADCEHGTYVDLAAEVGLSAADRDAPVLDASEEGRRVVPRDGGVLARHTSPRGAVEYSVCPRPGPRAVTTGRDPTGGTSRVPHQPRRRSARAVS